MSHDTTIMSHMGWVRFVGSLKLQASFAKEPYKRDYILQQRPIILRSLLIVANPYHESSHVHVLHDSFICVWYDSLRVPWLIDMCWMTHSYVWHDSCMYVTWLKVLKCHITHIWMSHATHINESYHTHMNESCNTCQWVTSHIWMSPVTCKIGPCHTCKWVTSHI